MEITVGGSAVPGVWGALIGWGTHQTWGVPIGRETGYASERIHPRWNKRDGSFSNRAE